MSILIVDDSLIDRSLTEGILNKSGYPHTIAMDSADAAYRYLEQEALHPDLPTVDLILMDIMMPKTNGLEACRSIKADPRLADIPLVMVTANTDEESLRQAFAAGAIDYIRKPILAVELVARVCTILTMQTEMTMRKRRERDLAAAMQELKALRGCAPICASCKRIQAPGGKWETLEEFVKAHSDLRVDDTLCQYCVEQWQHNRTAA
jgi:CheY-like chemotaxis protein